MRIGFLQAYFARSNVGGGEKHTEQLAAELRDRGHEVTIFTDDPGEGGRAIQGHAIETYPTPVKLNPINELVLAQRAFKDLQACDVVVLTDDSAWRGVDLPVPTVMIFHLVWHGWVARHGPLSRILRRKPQALLYRQMEGKICRQANAIISISPNMREDILLAGAEEDKIVDIPNGVDVDRFQPTDDRYDTFTVYFQGRLVDMKNPHLLVEAARRSNGKWKLIIGGTGPRLETLRQLIEEYDLEERVELIGYVADEELPRRYSRADLFALISDYEGMPLTVLEAAASGTAILASPRAATDFVSADMGTVIDPDPEAIARTIDELAGQPERVASMGEAARQRAENYSWTEIAGEYEAMFERLVKGKV